MTHINDIIDKLDKVRARAVALIRSSFHPRVDDVLLEFGNVLDAWVKRIGTKPEITTNQLSDILQKEISDFALYVFGKDSYVYFGSEMNELIEQLFGLARNQ